MSLPVLDPAVGSLARSELRRRLRDEGLRVQMGPFVVSVRSTMEDIVWNFENLYSGYPLGSIDRVADYCVYVGYPNNFRRFYHPQVVFEVDGTYPYKPYPAQAAIAMLEWGLNWTLFSGANQYLLFHAACLEKKGRCVILAGEPGSGKSTLCAAMALKAQPWRLFTDEITVVRPHTAEFLPLCRPICLKNVSIDIVEQRYPEAFLGRRCYNTAKGTVAHVRVPEASLRRMNESAKPCMILFPKYKKGAQTSWCELPKPEILMQLAKQSFNYSTLGEAAFQTLKQIVVQSSAYEVVYSDLDEVLVQLEELFNEQVSDAELRDANGPPEEFSSSSGRQEDIETNCLPDLPSFKPAATVLSATAASAPADVGLVPSDGTDVTSERANVQNSPSETAVTRDNFAPLVEAAS